MTKEETIKDDSLFKDVIVFKLVVFMIQIVGITIFSKLMKNNLEILMYDKVTKISIMYIYLLGTFEIIQVFNLRRKGPTNPPLFEKERNKTKLTMVLTAILYIVIAYESTKSVWMG